MKIILTTIFLIISFISNSQYSYNTYENLGYRVILLIGQSNAAGRALISNYDADYTKSYSHILTFKNDTIVPLRLGFNNFNPEAGTTQAGMEMPLSRRLGIKQMQTNTGMIVVKYAVGGTSMNTQWKPSIVGEYYDKTILTIDSLFDYATTYSLTLDPTWYIIFYQGEQDVGNTTYTQNRSTGYRADEIALKDSIFTHIQAITGVYPYWYTCGMTNLPVVTFANNDTIIDNVKTEMCNLESRCYFIPTKGLGMLADSIHLNYAGQDSLAQIITDTLPDPIPIKNALIKF